jgi:hypothetical protein
MEACNVISALSFNKNHQAVLYQATPPASNQNKSAPEFQQVTQTTSTLAIMFIC